MVFPNGDDTSMDTDSQLVDPSVYSFGGTFNDAEEISDADSDYREFNASLAKFRDSILGVQEINAKNAEGLIEDHSDVLNSENPDLNPSTGPSNQPRQHISRLVRPHRSRGPPRGPRKAAEPTADIKMRLGIANEHFQALNYTETIAAAAEIIRINAETYEAWNLIATSLHELGQVDNALKALMYAAHLRPKEPLPWVVAAEYALNETGSLRERYLTNAAFCYSGAIRANPRDLDIRFKKAAVLIERGNLGNAIAEYRHILSRCPHDLGVLDTLAELSIDCGDVQSVLALYAQSIAHFQSFNDVSTTLFDWSNVDVYITLHEFSGDHKRAILELKSIARWLLGRKDEEYWDNIIDNDCEWDLDDSRRISVPGFKLGKHPWASYGHSLPIQLRMKLGLYRLQLGYHDEAMIHFDIIGLLDDVGNCRSLEYSHLLRPIANHFRDADLHQEALRYYRPLANISEEIDAWLLIEIGKCHLYLGDDSEAEKYFASALQEDNDNIDARMELAKMFERLGRMEEAFNLVNQAMRLRRTKHSSGEGRLGDSGREIEPKPKKVRKPKQANTKTSKKSIYMDELTKAEHLKAQLQVFKQELDGMRSGNPKSLFPWMAAAKDLTDDFRGFKTFYPWDKFIKFIGYSGNSRILAETPLDSDLTAMAERLSRGLGAESQENSPDKIEIPKDYRGISFSTWLDIFLEYALCLARNGNAHESYEICEAAKDAIIFYHSREDMFLIIVAWCMCALFSNDEETCASVARFFMREYQFTTDSYRLFSAMLRICQSPVSWYSSGPTQKYVLRQIKAMDFALTGGDEKNLVYNKPCAENAREDDIRAALNMDIPLLMLYGHILYAGTSYAYALNYFLRADALDPDNPMICLSIGLAYMHHALKRQAENRQHSVLQGLTFIHSYYENRSHAVSVEERQEAHFNVARCYHLLGLVQLAIPYYWKVFSEISNSDIKDQCENVILDTAYNLQSIYLIAGNFKLAKQIVEKWLVI
ncbi:Transcription factor tau subunit sfc4 [Golovinomyces cichoracearum]|uniref:Transcription factor tau subunit sfc4 n=1 Tax=Golovinomyces cichoracearum TaxID=62708 RepID=A0A420J1V2_9PEZI|nr:Transcription factor tau subunit sfc4 [Golovinomyces cichoracearum]